MKELHNNPDLLTLIAYVYARQGRFDEALELQTKAAELDPLNPRIHAFLGQALAFTRQYDLAEQSIDRAITLAPENSFYYFGKMRMFQDRYRDIEKIKPIFYKALEVADTIKFIGMATEFKKYIPEFPWDSVYDSESKIFRDTMTSDSAYFFGQYYWYWKTNNTEMKVIYADSVRKYFEKEYQNAPENPYYNAFLGLLLSVLDECDQALELGQKGKELLSIEECHL